MYETLNSSIPSTLPTIYEDCINAQNTPKYIPLVANVLRLDMYHAYDTQSVDAPSPQSAAMNMTNPY